MESSFDPYIDPSRVLQDRLPPFYSLINSKVPPKIPEIIQEVDQHIFQVLLVGSVRSYKSTFINRFSGQAILPTDSSIGTRCPWVVTLGEEVCPRGGNFIAKTTTIQSAKAGKQNAPEEEKKDDGMEEWEILDSKKKEVLSIEFQTVDVLQQYIRREFSEEKLKQQAKRERQVVTQVEVGVRMPVRNCWAMQFVEFPGIRDKEEFKVEELSLLMRRFKTGSHVLLFVSLTEEFKFENCDDLWEVLNQSGNRVCVVLTNIHEYMKEKQHKVDGNLINSGLTKFKTFVKPLVKKGEEPKTILERLNNKLKSLTNIFAQYIQNIHIFAFDETQGMQLYYCEDLNRFSETKESEHSYLLGQSLPHLLHFLDGECLHEKENLANDSFDRLKLIVAAGYEHFIVQNAIAEEERAKLKKVEEEVSTLEGQFGVKFEFHTHRYFEQLLPQELQEAVDQFIEEDEKGLHGKNWRLQAHNFKKDLNVFLYGKLKDSFEKNLVQVQQHFLDEFNVEFERVALEILGVDCEKWFQVHQNDLGRLVLDEVSYSKAKFILTQMSRQFLLGLFIPVFVVLFMVSLVIVSAWTRKGQGNDVREKILGELAKAEHRDKIIGQFKELVGKKATMLKAVLDHILFEGLNEEQLKELFEKNVKGLEFEKVKESKQNVEQALQLWKDHYLPKEN